MEALANRIAHGVGLEPHEEKILKAAQRLLEAAGKDHWTVSAREHVSALETRLEHAPRTAHMLAFMRRETPKLHETAKKKRRR